MMKVKVDNTCLILNVKRNIYVNEDIQLVVQNAVNLYESHNDTFYHEIEAIDLVYIYVKGKQFQYAEFFNVKKSIKLIYDIDIDVIVDDNEYTDEHSEELGKYMAKKYQSVLKIM
jgi:hypothetical protein